MIKLTVNGAEHAIDVDPSTPLLWALRDALGLTETKYNCGMGRCGACTVVVEDKALRSCSVPVSQIAGKSVTTLEGLSDRGRLNTAQLAWLDGDIPKCIYCQNAMIVAVSALLKLYPRPRDEDIDAALSAVCRCGNFDHVRAAIHAAANA